MTLHLAWIGRRRNWIRVDIGPESVFRKPIKLERAVHDPVRNQMNYAFGTALNLSLYQQQSAPHHLFAEFVEYRRPDHNIRDPGFIAQCDEHDAGGPWHLAYEHDPCALSAQSVFGIGDIGTGQDSLFAENVPNEFHGIALQGEAKHLVVGQNVLAARHDRQWRILLYREIGRLACFEER